MIFSQCFYFNFSNLVKTNSTKNFWVGTHSKLQPQRGHQPLGETPTYYFTNFLVRRGGGGARPLHPHDPHCNWCPLPKYLFNTQYVPVIIILSYLEIHVVGSVACDVGWHYYDMFCYQFNTGLCGTRIQPVLRQVQRQF